MKSVVRTLVYLVIFAIVAVAGGIFIANAINRPTEGDSASYSAEFSNASGLRVGNDVRALGVRVGKVTAVALDRRDETSLARVSFSLSSSQHIYSDSKLAIRYLNLTGIRYLDLQQRSATGPTAAAGSTIGLESTVPSFDITTIFHGLAPVFAVMSPDDINHFSESLLALVQGDGTGFSRLVDSLNKVLAVVDDRSAVVNLLVSNLQQLSSSIGGGENSLTPIIGYLSNLGSTLVQLMPDLRHLADYSSDTLVSTDNFLASLGLRDNRTPDLDVFIGQIMPIAQSVVGYLSLAPGILSALNSALPVPGTTATSFTCSRGRASVPASIGVFIRGTQVTLCKR
ncbi:MCE family protein [Gordonia sp. TBRC 11910]|uniref:MCE family protein n=1 Tax=Gordonia asplenii TaxID=2725283 RepID=A0A848KNW5_9ACTN|nr:MlaD family protein [Gordonia asplenii]NMO00734.1 MCE family protein [Gordonia asplenii]